MSILPWRLNMIDQKYIRLKFAEAKKYLIKIDEVSSEEDLIQNLDTQLKVERVFEILTQSILDICTHISSKSNIGVPTSYTNCIDNLVQLNILPKSELVKFQNLIKMRNIIVHQYGKIDYSILFQGIKSLEKDFIQFQEFVLNYLKLMD